MTTTVVDLGDKAVARTYPGGANTSSYEVCTSYPVTQSGTVLQFMSYSGGMGSNAPRLQYCIFRPTSTANTYTIVGCTGILTFPNAGYNIVPCYIPVIPGDCLGYYKLDAASDISYDTGGSTWWHASGNGSAVTTSTSAAFSFSYTDTVSLQIEVTLQTTIRCNLQSGCFTNCFLRMDASAVTQFNGNGSGIVNVQYTAGPNEAFDLVPVGSGTMIRSVLNPNAFLRMDGTGITQSIWTGAGVVDCQYCSTGGYELFNLVANADGTISIESIQFPGVFLRLDGSTVTSFSASGGGTVNCQFGAGAYECYTINLIS